MSDIDPAAVKAAHYRHGTDETGACYKLPPTWSSEPCEPYRLADALAAEQTKVARVEKFADEQERMADSDDAIVTLWVCCIRAALADQPEQAEVNETEEVLKQHRRGPHVGDWADHKGGGLDPRRVVRVEMFNGVLSVWLRGLESDIGPFPAANYWFEEGPS